MSNHTEAEISHAAMSNEAAVTVAKDGEVFLLQIYALGQLG